jgi:putative addiction module component (TIGR02574 family)
MDSKSIALIQDEIRRLSAGEKEEVLRTLLEELDGPPDPDAESAWLKEVERRAQELESGEVICVPAEDVFRQLDALLKK